MSVNIVNIMIGHNFFESNDEMMVYIVIALMAMMFLVNEIFVKGKQSRNKPVEARIHKPAELRKYRPPKDSDEYIHISEHIQLDLYKKASKNNIILCLASSGSGKTFSFINNNLLLNMNRNKVVTDVGRAMIDNDENGFTFRRYYEEHGYLVKELDLYNFHAHDTFNPLSYVRYNDGRLIGEDVVDGSELIDTDFIESILKTIIPDNKNADPFWNNAVRDNILTIILYMFYCNRYKDQRNFITICKLFNEFLETDDGIYKIESVADNFETSLMELKTDKNGIKHSVLCEDKVGAINVLERLKGMRNDITGEGDYASSIKGSFKSSFSDRIMKGNVTKTIASDSMYLDSIEDDDTKTIWFITINDTSQNYNFIASMFYVTMFYMINSAAKKNSSNRLKRDVIFYLDEFGSSVYIDNYPTICSTIRKKMGADGTGGSIIMMVIQDFAQLKEKYGDGEKIIVANSAIKLYLGIDDYESMERVSKWGGNVINDLGGESRSSKSVSHSTSENIQPLISVNYLNEMEAKKHHCLLFMGGRVYEDRMFPYVKMKEFIEYMKQKQEKDD